MKFNDLPIELIDLIIKVDNSGQIYYNLIQTCQRYYILKSTYTKLLYNYCGKKVAIKIWEVQDYIINDKFLDKKKVIEHIKNNLINTINFNKYYLTHIENIKLLLINIFGKLGIEDTYANTYQWYDDPNIEFTAEIINNVFTRINEQII